MDALGDADRRTVLRLIAAGAATALAGCGRPSEQTWPRAAESEGDQPGRTRRYATALPLAGYARGVTGLVVDGRPIKLEGLAGHPASLGATDLFSEIAILDLYDPQRLRAPSGDDGPVDWSQIQARLQQQVGGSAGRGLRLLTGRVTSPSLLARIAQLQQLYPAMRHYRHEPVDDDQERAGAMLAFGRALSFRPRLGDADVIVALDADPLGPGPDQIAGARGWAQRRIATGHPAPVLHAIEPSLTQTGACADRRVAARPGEIADLLLVLAAGLGASFPPPPLSPHLAVAAAVIQRDCAAAKGRALVLVGRGQPAAVHALAAWVNQQLGAPAAWIEPVDPDPAPHLGSLAALAAEMHAGQVSTLVMLDSDPLYQAPATLGFAAAMARVPFTLAACAFPCQSAEAAKITLPLSSPLETWGDLRAADGTASLVQPLLRPLYGTHSPLEMLDLLDPANARSDHDRVRGQWQSLAGADPDRWWRDALVAGVIVNTASPPVTARAVPQAYPPSTHSAMLTLQLLPSPTLWDGRGATNAWAQECPDPLTKEVWGSALRIGATDAKALGVADGDVVVLGAGGETAVRIVTGQAPGVATLLLGQGRGHSGTIASAGANGFALRMAAQAWHIPVAPIKPTGEHRPTISTQGHFTLEGDLARLFPVVAPGDTLPKPKPNASLLPAPKPGAAPNSSVAGSRPQWAMAIDTAICIGCNACVMACQAENNIPAIGPEEMARNRDMHWLRIDRYDRGQGEDPRPGFQPVPCMQCEEAPCEPVCPVEASVHDHQGLNAQVYNRCVGTRTCQANCPYKVRRFNFFDYAGADLWQADDPGSISAQRNPDVTVRARGVMEKCTYCVQRIEAVVREADATGAPRAEVVTACQSACPTRAITFGDLTQPGAAVVAQRADPRHYVLLEELGTRPRTSYLAKLRAPGNEG